MSNYICNIRCSYRQPSGYCGSTGGYETCKYRQLHVDAKPLTDRVHQLKILPQYFQSVWNGEKTFELRKDDRDYQVGDILALREWDGEKYTGSGISVRITHILRNCPEYGLADGYCIMSIRRLSDD